MRITVRHIERLATHIIRHLDPLRSVRKFLNGLMGAFK